MLHVCARNTITLWKQSTTFRESTRRSTLSGLQRRRPRSPACDEEDHTPWPVMRRAIISGLQPRGPQSLACDEEGHTPWPAMRRAIISGLQPRRPQSPTRHRLGPRSWVLLTPKPDSALPADIISLEEPRKFGILLPAWRTQLLQIVRPPVDLWLHILDSCTIKTHKASSVQLLCHRKSGMTGSQLTSQLGCRFRRGEW